jgi:isocitrate dehydrogenase
LILFLGYGSLGLMTSVLVAPLMEPLKPKPLTEPSPDTISQCTNKEKKPQLTRLPAIFAWTRGLLHRAKLDSNAELQGFAETLERSVIETVENGFMTKDLAICVLDTNNVPREKYCTTLEFIQKVAEQLRANLKKPKTTEA